MFVYDIKTTEQVKNINGADLQDLKTAIENDHENYFSDEVKEMCERKQQLINKYGAFHIFYVNEL